MATPSKKSTRKASSKSVSQSKRAGLVFPVGRVGSMLRKGRYAARVSSSAATYVTAVIEYLVSEMLDRVGSMLRKGRYAARVSSSAATYVTAVIEYLVSETLDLAAKAVIQRNKGKRITPRALTLAVRHDADLGALLKDVTLSRGGVVPKVEKALEAKKKQKKSGKKSSATPKV